MNKLLVFSKQGCAPCSMVKQLLNDKDIQFEEVDAFDSPDKAADFGIMSVPVVVLVDEDGSELGRSGGFNPPEIEELTQKL